MLCPTITMSFHAFYSQNRPAANAAYSQGLDTVHFANKSWLQD